MTSPLIDERQKPMEGSRTYTVQYTRRVETPAGYHAVE
jgi:hypothetical protein